MTLPRPGPDPVGPPGQLNALLPDEKRAVATHEAGHALVAAISEHGDPVAKVTILPAGQALGVTEQLPSTNATCTPRYRRTVWRSGWGRVAEQLVFGQGLGGVQRSRRGARTWPCGWSGSSA